MTIDRLAVRNTFRGVTVDELNDVFERAYADEAAHAIILTGAADVFCSGTDITEMPDWSEMDKDAYGEFLSSVQGA